MSQSYIPNRDGDFRTWLINFVNVATLNQAVLGLTAAQITSLQTVQTGFSDALDQQTAAHAAAKNTTVAKHDARGDAESTVRQIVRQIQANPNVTDTMRAELGITVRDTDPSPIVPNVPADLTAYGFDNGTNQLRWSGNGNLYGTLYVIEASFGDSNPWQFVDVTTRTDFTHTGQVPGVRVYYRVRAKRTQYLSAPSNVAVVYGDPQSVAFLESEAA